MQMKGPGGGSTAALHRLTPQTPQRQLKAQPVPLGSHSCVSSSRHLCFIMASQRAWRGWLGPNRCSECQSSRREAFAYAAQSRAEVIYSSR